MTFPNLASTARGLHGARHVLVVALLLLLSVVAAILANTYLRAGDGPLTWWPAAGIDVVALVSVGRRYRWIVAVLIVLITVPISLAHGRPLLVAIVGAVAVALEAWIVTQLSVDKDDQPRLTTSNEVLRFFGGVLIGSVLAGVASGAAFAAALGGDFVTVAFTVFASHASAIAVIAPIALVNGLRRPLGTPPARLLHALMLAVSVFIAFAPGGFATLAFLPVPFLAWAAFSFSMSFALIELIAASGLIVVLTSVGGGPFVAQTSALLGGSAQLELYVVTLSVTTLLIAAARNERQHLAEQRDASARLLHQAFESSPNGFAILHRDGSSYRVLQANSAGITMLENGLTDEGAVAPGSALAALVDSTVDSSALEVERTFDDAEWPIPTTITATAVTHSTFGEIVLLSIIDLRPVRAAAEAVGEQLEREQRATRELRALNEQKDVFVSSITHELRTPITAVIGFTEELGDTDLTPVQRNYLAIVLRNAERLLRTIEDVLTVSTREPATDDDRTTVDLRELVPTVLDDLRHSIRDRDLEVEVTVPDEPVFVCAPVNDLTRIIVNIVTNAVKFTPAGGSITVALTVADERGTAVVSISDTGPGIDPADLERVFDRFYRSSTASRHEVPGTGLGLAIVRDLVEEMGGTVSLASDGSTGTTATVRLPVSTLAPSIP
jgi:signal transduction histidine kinase